MPTIAAILLTALGVATLHFCEATGFEHHREWAVHYGFPEPSFPLWLGGAIGTVAGSVWLGRCLARRRQEPATQ